MKKLASLLSLALVFTSLHAPSYAVDYASKYRVTVDGERQIVYPVEEKGTTLLPLSIVGQLFGYNSTWNNKKKEGTLVNGDTTIHFKLGSNVLKRTGDGSTKTVKMPVATKVIDGQTHIPIRATGEILGIKVNYDSSTMTIAFVTGQHPEQVQNTNTSSKKVVKTTPKHPSKDEVYQNGRRLTSYEIEYNKAQTYPLNSQGYRWTVIDYKNKIIYNHIPYLNEDTNQFMSKDEVEKICRFFEGEPIFEANGALWETVDIDGDKNTPRFEFHTTYWDYHDDPIYKKDGVLTYEEWLNFVAKKVPEENRVNPKLKK